MISAPSPQKQMKMAAKLSDRPPEVPPSAAVASLLATKQLVIDRFIPYISLYSRRCPSVGSFTTAAKSDRTAILKWFSSLSVHHRLSYLTIVDRSFAQLLLRMVAKLRSLGHCTFIILPDVPESPDLPSLCHRRSRGLMARIADSNESERLIRDSIRLFNSNEGEATRDSSSSAHCIDTVTFCEEFARDMDRFVKAMDRVSDSGFLMSDCAEMGADWVEFGWLKAQGYSSMEAIVANRVEVALRSAWLSCNSGKKRGVKLKEKVGRVGVAVNVYWRKKGCVDRWEKLDAAVKRKSLKMVLGKTAKFLAGDILRGADKPLDADMWFSSKGADQTLRYNRDGFCDRSRRFAEFGLQAALASCSGSAAQLPLGIKCLVVLQDIISLILASNHGEYDGNKLFFSSVDSVNTISDCILMKLRGVLMVVSLEYTKLELLEGGELKVASENPKEKFGGSCRGKKGKNHRVKPSDAGSKSQIDFATVKTLEDTKPGQDCRENLDFSVWNKLATAIPLNDLNDVEKEPSRGLVAQKVGTPGRKNRKEHKRKKRSGRQLNAFNDIQSPLSMGVRNFPCVESSIQILDRSTYGCVNEKRGGSSGIENHETGSLSTSNSVVGPLKEDKCSIIGADCYIDSAEGSFIPCLECDLTRSKPRESVDVGSKTNCVNYMVDSREIPPKLRGEKLESGAYNLGICSDSEDQSREIQNLFLSQEIQEGKNGIGLVHEQKIRTVNNCEAAISSGYLSFEWPSLAPHRFSHSNSNHLPHATDRLHLEVGHNWYNHFQQSSMQQMCPARNSQIDGNHGKILSQSSTSSDCPLVVRKAKGSTSSLTWNYDLGFVATRPCILHQGFASQGANFSAVTGGEERKIVDLSDPTTTQEVADEFDGHWVSEEECEVHTIPCVDYSQYFGGGIMYWNPSDYRDGGYSRPPSLSSDDSSWAWREADMNSTVDDMIAFSSSYSTNGLISPSTVPFSSPFEASGMGHHTHGYVRSGNEVSGKLLNTCSTDMEAKEEGAADTDAKSLDSFSYPMLRPIIIPSPSRGRSKSEIKCNHELRSPCIPPSRREQPRIKRPPSPVVLSVPRSPCPPPPAPVGDARKQRGFPIVRSGSSSPRHWGVRGWFHDGHNFDETCTGMDSAKMVWPSWGGKNFSSRQLVQPLVGALLQDQLIAISQLTHDQEHPDVTFPLQPPELLNCPTHMASLLLIQNLLHDEIDQFCKQVAAENLIRRPYINWAVKRVTRSLQVLWPRSRTSIFGSYATGLALPTSDVDLVVCLPPVRNLEPIKEAGILEGRNGIKETCLQHATRYLANQEWVKADSLKTVENTAIPIIMLVVEVPINLISSDVPTAQTPSEKLQLSCEDGISQKNIRGPDSFPSIHLDVNNICEDAKSIRLDISFKSPSHTGLQTAELVNVLTEQFPASIPLALVLKQFLADRSLDQSYSGGLSSYCLVLLIIRFLQHEHHHGRPTNQNIGSIFMEFLYFFGNVFDPRRMRISIQGSGLYIKRERGYSIDPIYIDDPLFPTNNVGKNCFRIHQCIKAFADAYSTLENEIICLADHGDVTTRPLYRLLPKIIPSIVRS